MHVMSTLFFTSLHHEGSFSLLRKFPEHFFEIFSIHLESANNSFVLLLVQSFDQFSDSLLALIQLIFALDQFLALLFEKHVLIQGLFVDMGEFLELLAYIMELFDQLRHL